MKKGLKIAIIILTIIVLGAMLFFAIVFSKVSNNTIATVNGVVVRVYETSMMVMGLGNAPDLFTVGFAKEGNMGFKQGQEILIYTNGTVMETYPAQLGKAGKIKIVKEKSETVIPDNILRFCYSSRNNVTVAVNNLTTNGITLTITDTNELPYNYSQKYTIYKKVKNPNYTGVGQKIGEDTENSTAGFTRNRSRIFMGRGRKNFKYFT